MFHIETTARCPRTPVLLFALAEAGAPFEVEIRPDGYFEETYREPGPRFDGGDGPRLGLSPLLEVVRTLAGLRPEGPEAAARADAWFAELEDVRAAMPKIVGARRAGREPAAEDLAVVQAFVGALEERLEASPWTSGDAFSSSDVGLSFVGFLSRVGLPVGARTREWLARVRSRPAWAEVLARYPSAGA